jgi:hypothetical protein
VLCRRLHGSAFHLNRKKILNSAESLVDCADPSQLLNTYKPRQRRRKSEAWKHADEDFGCEEQYLYVWI